MGLFCCFGDTLLELPQQLLALIPLSQDQQKVIASYARELASKTNEYLEQYEPFQILIFSVIGCVVAQYALRFSLWFWSSCSIANVKLQVFKFSKTYIPQVRDHIQKELDQLETSTTKKFKTARSLARKELPDNGIKQQDIVDQMAVYEKRSDQFYSNGGNITGAVYSKDVDHWNFISDIMRMNITSNPLHIDEFIHITQMEAEIIRWTANLYNGDKDTCGIITSGGTESIILCMLAYREKAKAERGVTMPNIVMSETAHCAFEKAGFYYQIEIRKVPLTKDFMCDLNAMKKQIDSNTICLVASAPEYCFGNFDPIEEIAALAQSYGIGCHSDCCLGSYVNPFANELGYKLPYKFDFQVPGVTSISCDPHKYAYGPKGCSIAMFRNKRLREYQFYVSTDWNGGIYATTTIAGSRPGNVIAGTWASMLKFGRKGLKEKAHKILEAQKQMKLAFKNDPDVIVCSTHCSPIFSWTSDTVNSIALGEQMSKKKWVIAKLQRPAAAHIAITDASQESWKDFINCVRECIKDMKNDKSLNKNHDTAVYGLTGVIPDKNLLHQFVSIHQAAMLDTL